MSLLFSPLPLREITLKNRVVVSPMCMYTAENGVANDFHFAHLARFALGGAGLVMVEATGVTPEGRITHGDLGLWNDSQIAPLARIVDFIRSQGAAVGIQLGHAGRRAASQRPWYGYGPLTEEDAARGDVPWEVISASSIPHAVNWLVPTEMTLEDIKHLRSAYVSAAKRAAVAGFDVLELHAAHGFLLNSFLSPLANTRTDAYGGSSENRMRLTLEITEAVREVWPASQPLSIRVSAVDGVVGGRMIEDTITLADKLKAVGVDVIDCSSGGFAGKSLGSTIPRGYGLLTKFAEQIKTQANITTMAVGMITDAQQAESILCQGQADLIALGRQILVNPNWPLHAKSQLSEEFERFEGWPRQYGWWLKNRESSLRDTYGAYTGNYIQHDMSVIC